MRTSFARMILLLAASGGAGLDLLGPPRRREDEDDEPPPPAPTPDATANAARFVITPREQVTVVGPDPFTGDTYRFTAESPPPPRPRWQLRAEADPAKKKARKAQRAARRRGRR